MKSHDAHLLLVASRQIRDIDVAATEHSHPRRTIYVGGWSITLRSPAAMS
jgi:hypothetical protein